MIALAVVFVLATGCEAPALRSSPELPTGWVECQGDEWTVVYPEGWFVHPADPAAGIAACALFAAEAFETERESDWGWVGAQIVVGLEEGCRGSSDTVLTEQVARVGGRAGTRRILQDRHDRTAPWAYEYFVDLTPDQPCETGRWFYARTEDDNPGSFEGNSKILDQMMRTLSFAGDE